MVRRFAKVSEEEIEEGLLYPSDLVNTKTTIPLRVCEERWIYTETRSVDVYIHHYSPPIREYIIHLVKLHYFINYPFFCIVNLHVLLHVCQQVFVSMHQLIKALLEFSSEECSV